MCAVLAHCLLFDSLTELSRQHPLVLLMTKLRLYSCTINLNYITFIPIVEMLI